MNEMLNDFIKYAKEQFGYDIIAEKSSTPDTFESIFGFTFLDSDADMTIPKQSYTNQITIINNDREGFKPNALIVEYTVAEIPFVA